MHTAVPLQPFQARVDRRGPGEETSYGNTGVIEGNTVFPAAFTTPVAALLTVAVLLVGAYLTVQVMRFRVGAREAAQVAAEGIDDAVEHPAPSGTVHCTRG